MSRLYSGNAISGYCRPPNPPIRVTNVHVRAITDHGGRTGFDDDRGHYIVISHACFAGRYTVIKILGEGSYGRVVEAYDKKRKSRCAIKIVRSFSEFRGDAKTEIDMLSTLAANDRQNRNKCIRLVECFDFRAHICIVTDLLGQSIFHFQKHNNQLPFPGSQIQNFARQLFISVAFLHDLRLVHTDLKPDNVLLVNDSYHVFPYGRIAPSCLKTSNRSAPTTRVLLNSELRLIDFGLAMFSYDHRPSTVTARPYRAPEILMSLGWSFPCDIWSIGCILVELYTGELLFHPSDDVDQLAAIQAFTGSYISTDLVRMAKNRDGHHAGYFDGSRLRYPNAGTSQWSTYRVQNTKHISVWYSPDRNLDCDFANLSKESRPAYYAV